MFDADFASNNTNWKWLIGRDLDTAPYFRIFNPVLQAEKFEAYEYTRKYVPELKLLPNKLITKPWEVSELVLKEANITLGKNYPKPIVDLKKSRDISLQLQNQIK